MKGAYPAKEPVSSQETLLFNVSFTILPNEYLSNMAMHLVLLSIALLLDAENFDLTPSEIMTSTFPLVKPNM